ncbi:MAG TPA: tetrapyrrole methylase, partial [Desulfobacteria bacterium]|nr:tetrapyrrole methylase [Desulfobacteria bacterium]
MANLKNRYFSTGFILVWLLAAAWVLPSAAAAWGRGHLYVIWMGPAGPRTATLQALDTLRRMDVIVAPQKQIHLFAEYVGQKPVLFDLWTDI